MSYIQDKKKKKSHRKQIASARGTALANVPYDEDALAVPVASAPPKRGRSLLKTEGTLSSTGPLSYVPPTLNGYLESKERELQPIGDSSVATATETIMTEKEVDEILRDFEEKKEMADEPMEIQGENQADNREISPPPEEVDTETIVIQENQPPLQDDVQSIISDASEENDDEKILIPTKVFDALEVLPTLVSLVEANTQSILLLKSSIHFVMDPEGTPLVLQDDLKQVATSEELKAILNKLNEIEKKLALEQSVKVVEKKVDTATEIAQQNLNITRGLAQPMDNKNRDLSKDSTELSVKMENMQKTMNKVKGSADAMRVYTAAKLKQLDSPHPMSSSRQEQIALTKSTSASSTSRGSELAKGWEENERKRAAHEYMQARTGARKLVQLNPTQVERFHASFAHHSSMDSASALRLHSKDASCSRDSISVLYVLRNAATLEISARSVEIATVAVVRKVVRCPDESAENANPSSGEANSHGHHGSVKNTHNKRYFKKASKGRDESASGKRARMTPVQNDRAPLEDHFFNVPSTSNSQNTVQAQAHIPKYMKKYGYMNKDASQR